MYSSTLTRGGGFLAALALVALGSGPCLAEEHSEHMGHMHAEQAAASLPPIGEPAPEMHEHGGHDHDAHAHHRAMLNQEGFQRTEQHYALPDLPVVDQDGRPLSLQAALDTDEPVMLNFIFTTCTTICPVLSATFAEVNKQLDPETDPVHMVSIAIDPEYDTPERLRAYAERFSARPNWQFLTGRLEDIIGIQRAFNAYYGQKMNHLPLAFLRASRDAPWVRIQGFASAVDIIDEYRRGRPHAHDHVHAER